MKRFLLIFLTIFLLFSSIYIAPAFAALADYQENCSANEVSKNPNCRAPTISDAQDLVLNMMGNAWALGGLVFMMLLIYNGAIYLLGSWEEAKYILGSSLEDVQKRMAQWGIGFIIFFLSYPIMNSALKLVVSDNVCYKDLQTPVVKFIFPEVCTYTVPGSSNTTTTPVTTNTPIPFNVTCEDFGSQIGDKSKADSFCNNPLSGCGTNHEGYYEKAFPGYETYGVNYIICNCQNLSSSCYGLR